MAQRPSFEEYCDTNGIRDVERGPAFAAYVDLLAAHEWDDDAPAALLTPYAEGAIGPPGLVALAALTLGAAAVFIVPWLTFH